MPTLCELAAEIVKAHASITQMAHSELLEEIQKVFAVLESLGGWPRGSFSCLRG